MEDLLQVFLEFVSDFPIAFSLLSLASFAGGIFGFWLLITGALHRMRVSIGNISLDTLKILDVEQSQTALSNEIKDVREYAKTVHAEVLKIPTSPPFTTLSMLAAKQLVIELSKVEGQEKRHIVSSIKRSVNSLVSDLVTEQNLSPEEIKSWKEDAKTFIALLSSDEDTTFFEVLENLDAGQTSAVEQPRTPEPPVPEEAAEEIAEEKGSVTAKAGRIKF